MSAATVGTLVHMAREQQRRVAHEHSLGLGSPKQHGVIHVDGKPSVLLVPGEPQRQQQVARLREKLEPRRKLAQALEQSSMRVPVYFHELAVATRLALFGHQDGLAQAMSRHNEHLVKCGVKGDFETAQ